MSKTVGWAAAQSSATRANSTPPCRISAKPKQSRLRPLRSIGKAASSKIRASPRPPPKTIDPPCTWLPTSPTRRRDWKTYRKPRSKSITARSPRDSQETSGEPAKDAPQTIPTLCTQIPPAQRVRPGMNRTRNFPHRDRSRIFSLDRNFGLKRRDDEANSFITARSGSPV